MPSLVTDPVIEPVEKPLDVIRPAAVDAYKAAVVAEGDVGREAILKVLGDSVPVGSLKTVDNVDGRLVVTDGTTSLAAIGKTREVYLVVLVDGQWTRKAGPLTSLVELGKALA